MTRIRRDAASTITTATPKDVLSWSSKTQTTPTVENSLKTVGEAIATKRVLNANENNNTLSCGSSMSTTTITPPSSCALDEVTTATSTVDMTSSTTTATATATTALSTKGPWPARPTSRPKRFHSWSEARITALAEEYDDYDDDEDYDDYDDYDPGWYTPRQQQHHHRETFYSPGLRQRHTLSSSSNSSESAARAAAAASYWKYNHLSSKQQQQQQQQSPQPPITAASPATPAPSASTHLLLPPPPPPPPLPPLATRRHRQWLIPAEHPLKILWDVVTLLLSLINAYMTHQSIQKKRFGSPNALIHFCECWFIMDMLLNFCTEYRDARSGTVLAQFKRVWARYLTTWFIVDALSLVPAESLFLQPALERQAKRGFWQKSFFRSKVVLRITRVLRGRHVKLFGRVAKQTKRAGMGGAQQLLRFLIRDVPRYVFFVRNNKAIMAFRCLRQVHWITKIWHGVQTLLWNRFGHGHPVKMDYETNSLTDAGHWDEDEDEDDYDFQGGATSTSPPTLWSQKVQLVYEEGYKTRRYNPYEDDDHEDGHQAGAAQTSPRWLRKIETNHHRFVHQDDDDDDDDDDDGAPF